MENLSCLQSERLALLAELNLQIGIMESKGDQDAYNWFDNVVIAPKLLFLRANGTIDDRKEFLSKITHQPPRTTEIESINFYGNRAVVTCIVEIEGKRFHNIRLFSKQDNNWKLFGWANELIGSV